MTHYLLVNRKPVVVSDLFVWAKFMTNIEARRVAISNWDKAGVEVSTVFLGLDHNHSGQGDPILFETMVFGGDLDGEMSRYRTWDEAEAGHEAMVARVSLSLAPRQSL